VILILLGLGAVALVTALLLLLLLKAALKAMYRGYRNARLRGKLRSTVRAELLRSERRLQNATPRRRLKRALSVA
jgi:hypothetical protein